MVTIWHPEMAKEFRTHFANSTFSHEDHINVRRIYNTMKQLSIWPQFEAISIASQSLERLISREERARQNSMSSMMVNFMAGSYHSAFDSELQPEYRFKVVTPQDFDYVCEAVDQVATCLNNVSAKKKQAKIRRFLDDIEIGGTLMFFLEKDERPVVYNKLFLVDSQKGYPALFYDSIENGNNDTNNVGQWKESGRMHELAYCVSFAAYVMQELDLIGLGLADRELDELGNYMGCARQYLLPARERKAGIPAYHNNKGEVVHQNRLYRKTSDATRDETKTDDDQRIKHRTMLVTNALSGAQLYQGFQQVYETLEKEGFSPKRQRFNERIDYLMLVSQAIMLLNSGSADQRAHVREVSTKLYRLRG